MPGVEISRFAPSLCMAKITSPTWEESSNSCFFVIDIEFKNTALKCFDKIYTLKQKYDRSCYYVKFIIKVADVRAEVIRISPTFVYK